MNKTAGVNAWGGNVEVGYQTGTDTLQWNASDQLVGSLKVNATGVANLNGYSDQIGTLSIANGGNITLGGGTLKVSGISGSAGGTISGGTLAGSLVTNAIGSGSATDILTISANISGNASSSFYKYQASTLKLQGANTGPLFALQSGVLVLDSPGALASGSEFKLQTSNSTLQAGTSDRSYSLNVVRFTSASGATYSFSGSNNLTLSAGNVLIDMDSTVDVAAGRTLTLGNGSASIASSSGSRALTKTGNGTLVLNGATATYSGLTTVSAGTLILNASLTGATGNVTVASAATIGGNATLASGRTLTLQAADSVLTPGTDGATGTFTVNSTFSATVGARLKFDLNGTGNAKDLLATNSTLNLGTGNTFTFDFNNLGLGTLAANTWVTIWSNSGAWGGNFTGNTFTGGNLTGGLVGPTFRLSGNNLQVEFSAVPEPATFALLAFSLTTVIVLRRRRNS